MKLPEIILLLYMLYMSAYQGKLVQIIEFWINCRADTNKKGELQKARL